MRFLKLIRAVMVGASCVGIVLPTSMAVADNAPSNGNGSLSATSWPVITDVALGENGTARGQLVDPQGVPVRGSQVVVVHSGQELAQTASDQNGYFRIAGLRGGVYQFTSARGGGTLRLWAPGTAPPAAQAAITLVEGEGVMRGQMPVGDYFASDRFILLSLIAAAIAIPVVIYNNRTDPPPGS